MKINRREFLRKCGRYTIAGAIGVLTARLVGRRLKAGRCTALPPQCRQCRELRACALPQAAKARRNRHG